MTPPGDSRAETGTPGGPDAETAALHTGAAPAPPPVLSRVAHFRIERELGAGGMGTVYLAHDERMNRRVALKVMARHSSGTAGRRFEQEAWIAGRLDHPNIVKVYERGEWEELSFYAMELVDGGTLAHVIERLRRGGRDETLGLTFGTSPYIHWVLRALIEVARGLEVAHRSGIVHRDIKPVNLLLSRTQGILKIADFGIAMDAHAERLTTTGTAIGTVLYMSPEQIRGDTHAIDSRSDVYALGVTLFEAITLQLPYSGGSQQIYVSQVLTGEARRARRINAQVSRDLDTVLRKAMERDAADRYPSAAAFADDLDNVLQLRPIAARPAGVHARAAKWVRRRPVHAALAVALVLATASGGFLGVRAIREHTAARQAHLADLLDEARWLGQREEYAAMLERATAALAIDSANVTALRHRAMARFRLGLASGDAASASSLKNQGLADVETVIAASPKAAWPHTLKAWMLTQSGRPEEAAAEAALAATLRPDPPSDEDVGEEARLASARQEHRQAVDLYSELIRRHPDSARAYSARATARENLGDRDGALVDYRVAVGLDPAYDLDRIGLARLNADRGQLDDARSSIDAALAADPRNPLALETQGRILVQGGQAAVTRGDHDAARRDFEAAEAASRSALERDAGLLWAGLNLATAIAERAKLSDPPDPDLMARAIAGYQEVLGGFAPLPSPGPQRDVAVAAQINLCDAQLALGRLQEALGTCARVTEIAPGDSLGYYNLAAVHARLGQRDEALAALARDVDLGDTDWETLLADAWFETLRVDARFAALIARMKTPRE